MIAEFIGSVNIFEGEITVDEADHCIIQPDNLQNRFYVGHGVATNVEDKRVWLAVRPEKTMMSREKPADEYNWAEGVVDDIAYLGGQSVYYIRLPGDKVVMCSLTNTERRADRPTWEDRVYISWEATSGVVLRV